MLPTPIHTYQNHHLDSLRWNHFAPRDDDIVIATSYKSGTTWMQEIVRQLINWAQGSSDQLQSPWFEARLAPLNTVIDMLEAQTHRRFIKTHLALDGLLFYPQVKYIVVGRDPRDVFMSFWNHYSNYTDELYSRLNHTPDLVGPPLPRCPTDIHVGWRDWITRGWFEWESEGYPFWGNLHHTQSWWNYRHLGNILFIHYKNLLDNLPDEIQHIASFLGIAIPDAAIATILPALSLDVMRSERERTRPLTQEIWHGGAKTFFFKGTNGRWKDVLSAEELDLYEATVTKVLTPETRAWLEQGRVALVDEAQRVNS